MSPDATKPTAAGGVTSTLAASSNTEESFGATSAPAADCKPTRPETPGSYYAPNAPTRTNADSGYVVSGNVLSADGCEPSPSTQIEF